MSGPVMERPCCLLHLINKHLHLALSLGPPAVQCALLSIFNFFIVPLYLFFFLPPNSTVYPDSAPKACFGMNLPIRKLFNDILWTNLVDLFPELAKS